MLASIYECDECFNQASPTSFTYRVRFYLTIQNHSTSSLTYQIGEAGEADSFLVELTWGEGYPDELPTISLDAFFNNHL